MKRLLIGISAAASLFATNALAADLPAKAPVYTKAPVYVEPPVDWTGFYVGGNIGYSWGRSNDTSTVTNGLGTVVFTATDHANLDGVVGGGQFGYNWQMQNWVFGLEADIQGTGEKGTHSYLCPIGTCVPLPVGIAAVFGTVVSESLSQKIDWFGTARGRIGVLAAPKVLLYATGGLAYGEVDTNATIGAVGGVPTVFPSASNINVGWTVGAGVEGVIAGNWTARLEYLYVDLGKVSGAFATTIGTTALTSFYSSRITDNIVRVGVNYKFGGPVVAKY